MTTPYVNSPTIIQSNAAGVTTLATPTIVSVGQANLIVVGSVVLPSEATNSPVAGGRLYRSIGSATPQKVDERGVDANSLWINLFDLAPEYGTLASYTATAFTQDGTESAQSTPATFTAFANPYPIQPANGISASAYGPYPLLGSDVYLDPATGDGVVGPNGDMLTVNGLELLAQDLRIRIITIIGELPLHSTFGFFPGRVIGSGQSNPQATAALLRQRVFDCIGADPRVASIDNVTISFSSYDSWTISYTVYAIGVEDPLYANLVFPYSQSS